MRTLMKSTILWGDNKMKMLEDYKKIAHELLFEEKEIDKGIHRTPRNLALEGLDVFTFSLREVAPNIKELYAYNSTDKDDYDYYVFH